MTFPLPRITNPFGRPLRRAELEHQVLPKRYALPVFASDALSSVAYATEEILKVLALAGALYFSNAMWISALIVGMLVVLLISYRQTIFAYPSGGGAYIVSRDNLGEAPAQVAGAALLVDYVLTVSVSIASGVANFASGLHQFVPSIPAFDPAAKVITSLIVLAGMWYLNKRGVRESGRAFAVPTYFFVASIMLMLAVGLVRSLTGTLPVVTDVAAPIEGGQALTLFLLLRAFASGSTAVTGVEAISNGIPAFQEPKSRNAATTMAVMCALLAVMFLGITRLALATHAQASESETVISQLGRTVFSAQSPFYVAVIFGTALVLVMAANTSFADFPRLAALQAGDGFLPRWLLDRDNRLVFGIGITVLSGAAGLLLVIFEADLTRLIPLYAIGVFLSFTLSQTGMVIRWRRVAHLSPGEQVERVSPEGAVVTTLHHDRYWRPKLIVNAIGAVVTATVTVIFAAAKFTEGAWMVVVLIPLIVLALFQIHRHYLGVRKRLQLGDIDTRAYVTKPTHSRVILVVGSLQQHTLLGLRELYQTHRAGSRMTAIHVDTNEHESAILREEWARSGLSDLGIELKFLPSGYGAGDIVGTLVDYVRGALQVDPELRIHVAIPDWSSGGAWSAILAPMLHHLTALRLRLALLAEDRVTVTNYRYSLGRVAE